MKYLNAFKEIYIIYLLIRKSYCRGYDGFSYVKDQNPPRISIHTNNRTKAPMIQMCKYNFRTMIEIFLQNRITLLSHDLGHHVLRPLLYFDSAKCGHYIQDTQIRKEYSVQSVSCFQHKMSSQQFFSYVMFKLLLLGYLLAKKGRDQLQCIKMQKPHRLFLDKVKLKWQPILYWQN